MIDMVDSVKKQSLQWLQKGSYILGYLLADLG